jgi:hypothetical protein
MNKELVAIVIPIYKSSLSLQENISLSRCFEVFKSRQIIIVCPVTLVINLQEIEVDIRIERFADRYFNNIEGYNKLLLSTDFYERLNLYKYILIYQLDCYVFRDEIESWCMKDYDYIGAPWVDQNIYKWLHIPNLYPIELKYYHKIIGRGKQLSKVGNGGLSLRKVESMINNVRFFSFTAKRWKAFEDSFFSHYVGTFNPFFRMPDFNTALRFSFDENPEKCFALNDNELPFACHAWFRTDSPHYGNNYSFWKSFIK